VKTAATAAATAATTTTTMINPGGRRPWQSHVDMYRKIPTDLMEGTGRGSILSYLSLILMVVLFFWETNAYFTTNIVTDLALDKTDDPRLRLNFNITMTDLPCEWAVIDVVSVLGTDQNVTAHVTKWNIDGDGVRKGYKGRNRNQKDIEMYDSSIEETLEELHEDGEDAVSLNEETLKQYKENYEYAFVDFYASWCSHCMDLAPTWEVLAEVMTEASLEKLELDANEEPGDHPHKYSGEDFEHALKIHLPVAIGKVDCVTHKKICNEQENIRAYPTLRLFIDGKVWNGSDYKGHRTVMEMVDWLVHMEEEHKKMLNDEGNTGELVRNLHKAHESKSNKIGGKSARRAGGKSWYRFFQN
jgi:thiol-disulfide isomerase/thioredoxin